jgi:hypothetical protein
MRPLTLNGNAMHMTSPTGGYGTRVEVAERVVVHAAVVPERDGVLAPAETASELRTCGMFEQELD